MRIEKTLIPWPYSLNPTKWIGKLKILWSCGHTVETSKGFFIWVPLFSETISNVGTFYTFLEICRKKSCRKMKTQKYPQKNHSLFLPKFKSPLIFQFCHKNHLHELSPNPILNSQLILEKIFWFLERRKRKETKAGG